MLQYIAVSCHLFRPSCGQADGGITITPSPAGNYTYAWSNSLPAQAAQSNLPAETIRCYGFGNS
ncbi:MAG: hypothetical protein U0T72_07715 [Chitinophagales bacterium]